MTHITLKNSARAFALAVSLWCLSACGQSIPLDTLPDTLTYIEYYNGNPISTTLIHKGDAVYEALYGILSANAGGWESDAATYPMAEYFRADGIKINCMDTLITLSYRTEDNGWMQLSKKIAGCRSAINQAKLSSAK